MASQAPAQASGVPGADEQEAEAAQAATTTSLLRVGTPERPSHAAPTPSQPAYLVGALQPFVRRADVLFLAGSSASLPAHSQLLARCCSLFADILEASHAGPEPADTSNASQAPAGQSDTALVLHGQPSPAAPLRVPVHAHSRETVELLLLAVYQPHRMHEVVASVRGAAAYGALADLAAFCG